MDIIDDHESYHVKIVKRERMVLTSVQVRLKLERDHDFGDQI